MPGVMRSFVRLGQEHFNSKSHALVKKRNSLFNQHRKQVKYFTLCPLVIDFALCEQRTFFTKRRTFSAYKVMVCLSNKIH